MKINILNLFRIGSIAAFLTMTAVAASAQQNAGAVFNGIFNVGGAGSRGLGGEGDVGCGGESGNNLTAVLDAALGESIGADEGDLALSAQRELWRFCNAMTDVTGVGVLAGWTADNITPAEETQQNTDFAPAGLFTQSDVAKSMGKWQMQNVAARISQLRMASRSSDDRSHGASTIMANRGRRPNRWELAQVATHDLEPAFQGHPGSGRQLVGLLFSDILASGADGENVFGIKGLGAFANGQYHRLDASSNADELGSETNGGGFTVGADYMLNDKVIVGGAFGYNRFSTDFDRDRGDSSTDDYGVMVFGSVFLNDAFYLDGLFRSSIIRVDQTRKIESFDNPDPSDRFESRSSSPSGWTTSGDIGFGMDHAMGALTIAPSIRFKVLHTQIDSFTESGGDGSLNLRVNKQRITSLPLTIGATMTFNISTKKGVVSPYVRTQYQHEFGDQAKDVTGHLVVIESATFRISPNGVDRNYVRVGGGVSMALAGGWGIFADYDGLFAYDDLSTHSLTAGIRAEF